MATASVARGFRRNRTAIGRLGETRRIEFAGKSFKDVGDAGKRDIPGLTTAESRRRRRNYPIRDDWRKKPPTR